MDIADIPMGIIIAMPIVILCIELLIHGLGIWWEWFINDGGSK